MSTSSTAEVLKMNESAALEYFKTQGNLYLAKFVGGMTLYNQETGRATIVINSDLDSDLQAVYFCHEEAQLAQIVEARDSGIAFGTICYVAHRVGLDAGVAEAQRRGVLDKYLHHREVSSVEELE